MWVLVLGAGFTREQKQNVAQGRWQSAMDAYLYARTHYFGNGRLFHKQYIKNEELNIIEIQYKGINDDGHSAELSIKQV